MVGLPTQMLRRTEGGENMFKVQKKDGTLEDFDRSKIINGVVKAGGSAEDGEKVAVAVEAWLPTAAVAGTVQAMAIRDKGLAVLRAVNPTAAASFEAYKKSVV